MDERQPLLPDARSGGVAEQEIDSHKRNRRSIYRMLCSLAILLAVSLFVATAVGTIVYGTDFSRYPEAVCRNVPTFVGAHTRSGSYSLLVDVRENCYESQVDVSLMSPDSSVEVFQTFCEDIETKSFKVPNELDDLTVTGDPQAVFNENFSPQNYFLGGGSIEVEITNASFTANHVSFVNVSLCMFTNKDYFDDFLGAGKNWKNNTNNAECNSTAVANGEYSNVMSFRITKPSFVFIGIVSNVSVHFDRLNLTASGKSITHNLGSNSTKECQLLGDSSKTKSCTFDLLENPDPEFSDWYDVCIVAYEEDNPDGSYDYSNLSIGLIKHHNPHRKAFEAFGFSLLSVIVLLIVTVILITVVVVWELCRNTPERDLTVAGQVNCSPVLDTRNQDDPYSSNTVGTDHGSHNVSYTESAKPENTRQAT